MTMWFNLFVLLASFVGLHLADKGRILYNTVSLCKPNEFFDVNAFQCQLCEPVHGLQPAADRLSCRCNPNNASTTVDYDNLSKRPICDTSLLPVFTNHTACPIKHLILIASNSVQTQHVQIHTDLGPNCTPCNPKTSVIISHYSRDYCVAKPLINDLLAYNAYRPASPIYQNLTALVFFCQTMKDTRSCNRLANLCVLSKYGVEKLSPCSLFYASSQTTVQQPHVNAYNLQVWPLVFFKVGKESLETFDAVLDQKYDTEYNSEKSEIQLLQTRFNVQGELSSMQPLSLNDLNMCQYAAGQDTPTSNAIRFGGNIDTSCRVSILHMISEAERCGTFMDVYMNYTTDVDKKSTTFLVPVPVLVSDVFSSNDLESDREKWQLVQRIVLVDTFTEPSIQSPTSPDASFSHLLDLQRYKSLRYINHIELKIRLAEDHENHPNQISTPLLLVRYGQLNTSSMLTSDRNAFVEFTFKIEFTKAYDLMPAIQAILSLLITLAVVGTICKTARYKTRQQREFYDVDIFGKFLMFLIGHMADALFGCVSMICVYLLYTYLNQSVIRIILPVEQQDVICLFLYIAVPLKFFAVMHQLWVKCNLDIFFVDWERPKAFDNHTLVKNNIETPSISSGGKMLMYEGVSAWRTFFVANEWLKLMTRRRSSMRVQIMVIVSVFLFYFNRCPTDTSAMWSDPTMKMAAGLLLYGTVYMSQRLIQAVVFERYLSNSVQRFVDICSLANVSLFVLQLETFGYYVHGRSPHGFSDTDMCSMTVQLKREELNTFGHRGLMLNSDQQTFVMLLPHNLRVLYDRLITSTSTKINSNESGMERTAAAYYNINRFLNAFIDHGLKDMDYMIQEKTILQRVLNFEDARHCNENRGVFYSDSGNSFACVLFHGNEIDLFCVEIMVFVLFGSFTGSYLIGMLIVGALNRVLRIVFARLMKRNLARKSLIESRFLM